GVWVHAGTGICYEGTVDIQALTNTTQNGLIVEGNLNGVPLEYITRALQKYRTDKVVSYAGTGICYEGAPEIANSGVKANVEETMLMTTEEMDLLQEVVNKLDHNEFTQDGYVTTAPAPEIANSGVKANVEETMLMTTEEMGLLQEVINKLDHNEFTQDGYVTTAPAPEIAHSDVKSITDSSDSKQTLKKRHHQESERNKQPSKLHKPNAGYSFFASKKPPESQLGNDDLLLLLAL
ncbi:hypothetical protein ACQUW5_13475, partial [Legionella sp. CNM-1927-20]|uniref:hypothetical protein n=1 Tax=Legionella sp. CNM-1927-20 TaxID=3422221 RepID=UPI00403AE959